MEIEAVICDMDGTLVDTEGLHLLAWNMLIERFGHQPPSANWNEDCIGLPDSYAVEKTKTLFPDLRAREDLLQQKQEIFRSLVLEKRSSLVFPSVREKLVLVGDTGVGLAVGTNTVVSNARATLGAAGLLDFFPVLVTADMVARAKPYPDIYLEAAARLGLPSGSCAVIEDSVAGLEAARAAGCLALGVTTTWPAAKLTPAERVFADTASAIDWVLSERLKHA